STVWGAQATRTSSAANSVIAIMIFFICSPHSLVGYFSIGDSKIRSSAQMHLLAQNRASSRPGVVQAMMINIRIHFQFPT
ncbi:MAG: hypothetical protein ACK2T4_09995, partial [Candidatus Promineifilaceae bacterium]